MAGMQWHPGRRNFFAGKTDLPCQFRVYPEGRISAAWPGPREGRARLGYEGMDGFFSLDLRIPRGDGSAPAGAFFSARCIADGLDKPRNIGKNFFAVQIRARGRCPGDILDLPENKEAATPARLYPPASQINGIGARS
jgi:hypothetical protein